jgi:hypothetical protein
MADLEVTMKKHNINIDSTSSSFSSHGHALSASGFSFNATSTSSDEWLIDYGASYHMGKDKDIFSPLNECNTKKICVGDDISLIVVGSGTVQVDNSNFNDVLCVPSLSALNECNTKKICVGDDISLCVVGSGTVQVDNGNFNDVLCVPSIMYYVLQVYQYIKSLI